MLRDIRRVIVRSYQVVEAGLSRIAAVTIMLMMFLTTVDVIGRYVFNSPILGAYEISEVLLVGVVFLGLAYVQSQRGNVKVDVVTSWMPQDVQLTLDTLGYLIGFIAMVIVTWQSGILAWRALVTGDHSMGLLRIPLWPGKSVVSIGTGLLCLRLLADVVSNISLLASKVTK